jgi:iron complex transport system substrate-binding protein
MLGAILVGAVTALRVISLAPNLTEDLYAIGAGPQVVAVDAYSDRPAAAKALPHVGALRTVNVESMLALHPDLVIGIPYQTPALLQLSRFGIKTDTEKTDTLADDFTAIERLGKLTGHEREASQLLGSLRKRLAAVASATADLPRSRVFVLVSVQPIYTAGAGSYIDDLLHYAHVTNVTGDLHVPFPNVSAEVIQRDDPDVIITTPGTQIPADVPPWSRLRAVREHRIVRLSEADLFRAGPHVADVLEALVRAIAPYRSARTSERPGAVHGERHGNAVYRARRLAAPASAPRRRRSG